MRTSCNYIGLILSRYAADFDVYIRPTHGRRFIGNKCADIIKICTCRSFQYCWCCRSTKLPQALKVRYAVQSSVLIDELMELHMGSIRTVASHVAIGFTGQFHRQSSVVGEQPPQARYRASCSPGLYHSCAACANLLNAAPCRYRQQVRGLYS